MHGIYWLGQQAAILGKTQYILKDSASKSMEGVIRWHQQLLSFSTCSFQKKPQALKLTMQYLDTSGYIDIPRPSLYPENMIDSEKFLITGVALAARSPKGVGIFRKKPFSPAVNTPL